MRLRPGLFALLLVCGCARVDAGAAPSPGRADVGDWVSFYTRDFEAGRLSYFYDASRIARSRGRLVARWKVLGSRDASTTLYVIEIDCRTGRATERGTVLIDADGRARELPRSELVVDRPIEANTSADRFRHMFCR
jgi:hypothetical protein